MALVIRRVDDASLPGSCTNEIDPFLNSYDFSQDRIQRMLECTVHFVPLRRSEFFEVAVNGGLCLAGTLPAAAL